MGRQHKNRRSSKIRINKKRKEKLGKLRKKYLEARFDLDKEKILNKILKLVPWLTKEEFEGKKKQS